MSAIHHYRSGSPLAIGGGGFDSEALFNPGLRGDVLLPREKQILPGGQPSTVDPVNGTPYLNPDAFGTAPLTANGVPLRFGNAPRWLPNLRGFAIFDEDFSLVKRTALGFREGATFEVRMDVINLFNRTRLSDPATGAGDPTSFGRIFGKDNVAGPRNIQVGARINF
jgi:hypothetical protein